jgi:ligand-binding sensor domain-containing protein
VHKHFYKKLLIVFLLVAAYCGQGKAQSYWENIDYFTTRNGLPNNTILSLYQDSKGFLWVGTSNGLCRYDGTEFKLFPTNFLPPGEIWYNAISVITEDKSNNLWIGTRSGVVACLDNTTNTWKWFRIKDDFITDIFFDRNGTKWVGTKQNKIGKIINGGFVQAGKIDHGVYTFKEYSSNQLLVLGGENLLMDINTGELSQFYPINTPNQKGEYCEGVISSKDYLFYFINNKKIESCKFKSKEKHLFDYDFNFLENKPGVLDNGDLLLLNDNSLAEITPQGETVYKINFKETTSTLRGNTVNVTLEDKSGLIWIGTNAGLFKVDRKKTQFKKYTANTLEKSIKYNYIRSLYTVKNELWIGAKEGQIGKLTFDTITGEQLQQQWFRTHTPNGQPDYAYTANCIVIDGRGDTWAGGSEELYRMRKNETFFRKIKTYINNTPIFLSVVWTICEPKPGYILVGGAACGLLYINTETMEAKECTVDGHAVDFSVWNIFKSSSGELWVGTKKGLYKLKYDKATGTYTMHNKFIANAEQLWQGNIWSITEDIKNQIWFGTTETGVTMLNPKTGGTKKYDINSGLVSNVTSGIVADREGNIWISTINGLSKLEVDKNRFENFMEADGLLNNDFNFKVCAITAWDEIYLGSKVGITAFYPKNIIYTAPDDAPVEITSIRVKGDDINYNANNTIQLSHNQNDITLRFALLDYRKEFHHTYKYKLEGYQTEWQESGHDNPVAVYTNLPPGKYTFIVNASANGSLWSKKTATTTFIIKPAFWQRPYFWFIIIVGIVVIIILAVRMRIRSIIKYERESARIQKAMAELEMKALRAQMNPHFIFNAIGAIQHYILKKDTLQANEYLARFSKLMRTFLESSRNNYTSLANEVSMLSLYISLEKLRFEDKFDYQIIVDEKLSADDIQIPSMLLQPFVENAINHGLMHKLTKGNLTISFSQTNNNALLCVIDDDGIGRQKAGQLRRARQPSHISRGGDIVQDRVKTFLESGDIAITINIIDKFDVDSTPCGTTVEVKIPYK